jgi:hypothetical protein
MNDRFAIVSTPLLPSGRNLNEATPFRSPPLASMPGSIAQPAVEEPRA